MSDAAILTLVSGAVTITTMLVGFLTLWVKLKYGVKEAKEAADGAALSAKTAAEKAQTVETKLDANTAATHEINQKTDTVVEQTNGGLDQTRLLVAKIAERVDKLEEYNHVTAHRLFDAINTVNMKVTTIAAIQTNGQPALLPKSEKET